MELDYTLPVVLKAPKLLNYSYHAAASRGHFEGKQMEEDKKEEDEYKWEIQEDPSAEPKASLTPEVKAQFWIFIQHQLGIELTTFATCPHHIELCTGAIFKNDAAGAPWFLPLYN